MNSYAALRAGLVRNQRVLRTGKTCYFRWGGGWWVAAPMGGSVYVRELSAETIRECAS